MSIKKERISIPPNNEKLWRYLTEGLSGRTNSLPSYPKSESERKKIQEGKDV